MSDPERKLETIIDPPSAELIERLERLLADAKTGELQGLVYVSSYRANFVSSGWTTIRQNRIRIMGELFQAMHQLASLEPL